jgi:2',3'-cyclic-nucleotide 2'-phosphodiesterase (5'-nucleotidase family)
VFGALFAAVMAAAVPLGWTPRASAERRVTVSVVATTDVHGHVESLPWLGGHLAVLRAHRAATGGGVLLVDSGDMFQGTMESNLGEGAAMVAGYNALGYTAAAIGNHEFDFGPTGPAHIPARADQDPRGALKERAAAAKFPFLAANLEERGKPLRWRNVRPWVMAEVAGVRIAIVGTTTMSTPRSTHPRNFAGMAVLPMEQQIARYAREARKAGAMAVVVATHAGGNCARLDSPDSLDSCRPDEEIMYTARAVPRGLIDVIAAGHTHQQMAHRVAGVAVVQAGAEGRAFSRVDLEFDLAAKKLVAVTIQPPRALCEVVTRKVPSFAPDACRPPPYEGQPVRFDTQVAAALAPGIATAAARRAEPIGVTIQPAVVRRFREESPLGNLAADLIREVAGAQAAFINGGSLRADLPAGPLRYGGLYEAFPFDDGLATMALTGAQLGRLVARNLGREAGFLSLSGVRAVARCQGAELQVSLTDDRGRPIDPAARLTVATNGYLASGGDGLIEGIAPAVEPAAEPLRDQLAARLAARGGVLRGDDKGIFDPAQRRVSYSGARPVRCTPTAKP